MKVKELLEFIRLKWELDSRMVYETSKQNINVIVNAFEEEIKKEG